MSNPNNLIGMAIQHMKDFRFSHNEAAEVGMFPEDTGVIILIILYFIDKEKKICRSKLEYYLLLLDKMCFEKYGVPLFHWYLRNGRIKNFRRFTEFMINKNLIFSNGNAYFQLTDTGKTMGRFFAELSNIKLCMDEILSKWIDKTADQVKAIVVPRKHNQQYKDALNNINGYLWYSASTVPKKH